MQDGSQQIKKLEYCHVHNKNYDMAVFLFYKKTLACFCSEGMVKYFICLAYIKKLYAGRRATAW